MSQSISRTIFRWIHLIVAIPIVGYIYSPFDRIPHYATPTRYVFFPSWSSPVSGCGRAISFDGWLPNGQPEKPSP